MNKKQFNYFLKNPQEITAPTLGLMMLYDDCNSRVAYKYNIPDSLIIQVMKDVGQEGDWYGYRNILGIINSLRYNFVEAEVYKRSAFNHIGRIKTLFQKYYLSIILNLQEPNEILKAINEKTGLIDLDTTEAEAIKVNRANLEECIVRVLAFNKYVKLLSKLTETTNVKNFLVNLEPLKDELKEITETSIKLRSITDFIPVNLKNELDKIPILEFDLTKYEPSKINIKKVRDRIQLNGAFLNNNEMVNNVYIRKLIYGED